jgi:L-lysine 2,3-aminomutase
VRIGSKIPVFLPQRILEDEQLVNALATFNQSKPLYIVAHFDHPNEISDETKKLTLKLAMHGITVFGQIVLLKDVNSDKHILSKLLEKLIEIRVIPYYIFHTMPVAGAGHFQVPLEEGFQIVNGATQMVSGLSKKIRFIIPHYIGKVEFLGYDHEYYYMKHHQARDSTRAGLLFKVNKKGNKYWFNAEDVIYL